MLDLRRKFILCVLLLLHVDLAQGAAGCPVDAMAGLARGVNVSGLYSQRAKYDRQYVDVAFNEIDLGRLVRAGFTHVRLAIGPQLAFSDLENGVVNGVFMLDVAKRVESITKHGLTVIVDFHPGGSDVAWKRNLGSQRGADGFISGWSAMAKYLEETDPKRVFVEVLNEPDPLRGEYWRELQKRAIVAIRTVLPQHCLIANPGGWSSIDDLIEFRPYHDLDNVLYTFHWYAPMLFTHQGAPWLASAKNTVGVRWPIEVSESGELGDSGMSRDVAERIRSYVKNGTFAREFLAQRVGVLNRWRALNGGAAIYVGEFGVIRTASPAESRYRWLENARRVFERNGIGWAVWSYVDPVFGLGSFDWQESPRRISGSDRSALGLQPY